jgi:hypothetical protein
VDGNVTLLIAADVGCGGTDSDVSIESEEREDDEEDTAFKDSGF